MAGIKRTHLADLRGASRLAIDATAGVTDVVERMHGTIQRGAPPIGRGPKPQTFGITRLVYRSIQGTIAIVGRVLDASLSPWIDHFPEGDTSPARDAALSILNGIYGDHLVATANPLALPMTLRCRDQHLDLDQPLEAASGSRLVLFIHGLCLNERHWRRSGEDFGMRLQQDLGLTPLYLRYNTGTRITHNGARLATLLETLVERWPAPIKSLTLIGHSMGGLVARSACYHAQHANHAWLDHVDALVTIGTPHQGAPLERGGGWLDQLLQVSPYSAPFARLTQRRSAGINDLRDATIAPVAHVPLPEGVACYAIATTLGDRATAIGRRLSGDGLVPIDSALGEHNDPRRALHVPNAHQWVGYRINHMDQLHHPEVYEKLLSWLCRQATS